MTNVPQKSLISLLTLAAITLASPAQAKPCSETPARVEMAASLRKADEDRRRAEAEERARQAATRAAIEGRPRPMILQGAPPSYIPGDPYVIRPRGEAPPLPPPLDIQSVPRPLSRSPLQN